MTKQQPTKTPSAAAEKIAHKKPSQFQRTMIAMEEAGAKRKDGKSTVIELQRQISALGFPNRGSRKMLRQEQLRHELRKARAASDPLEIKAGILRRADNTNARFAQTPLAASINERKRDCDLILGDVSKRDWKSVAQGMQYQIDAWTELRAAIARAEGRAV
jgi:hypothetical protein